MAPKRLLLAAGLVMTACVGGQPAPAPSLATSLEVEVGPSAVDLILHVTNAADQITSYTLKPAVVAQINAMNPGTVITVQFAHTGPVSASLKFTYTGTSGTLSVNNPLVVW